MDRTEIARSQLALAFQEFKLARGVAFESDADAFVAYVRMSDAASGLSATRSFESRLQRIERALDAGGLFPAEPPVSFQSGTVEQRVATLEAALAGLVGRFRVGDTGPSVVDFDSVLSAGELAARLGVTADELNAQMQQERDRACEWSKQRDPECVGWYALGGDRYSPSPPGNGSD